jgi:hypothetical protein
VIHLAAGQINSEQLRALAVPAVYVVEDFPCTVRSERVNLETRRLQSLSKALPVEVDVMRRLRSLGVRSVCVLEGFGCSVRSDGVDFEILPFPVALEGSPGAQAAFAAARAYRLIGRASMTTSCSPSSTSGNCRNGGDTVIE